jgi:ER membrane protein complex subunit 2
LKYLGRQTEAVVALNSLLEASPTDAEAWAELAELYITQGLYQQGIFALEEVLLITPNAWNVSALEHYRKPIISHYANNLRIQIHARLGEAQYAAAAAAGSGSNSEVNASMYLTESLRRFCRSIELCDDYLRGYYGLKLVTSIVSGSFRLYNANQ